MKILSILRVTAFLFPASVGAAEVVRVCADIGGFPPYSYQEVSGQGAVQGMSVDLVTAIMKSHGKAVEVEAMPWKRCLAEVEKGTRYAMVLDATYNDERAVKYLLSDPLYQIHSALYYDPKRFPTPPKVNTAKDMLAYRYCGISGYNYAMYPLPAQAWDMSAADEVARFKMLRAGRCDFALADVEPLLGFVRIGQMDLWVWRICRCRSFQRKITSS